MPFEQFPELKDGNKEKQPKFQGMDSVVIKEAKEGDPDYENATEISTEPEDSEERLKEKVREELIRKNWWFKEEWIKKGIPKEQILIKINGDEIDIYNWHEPIKDEQINTIKNVVKEFFLIDKEALMKNRYILIDDERKKHFLTGEEENGYGAGKDRAMILYPRAFEPIEHRVPGVSNLEGTTIHELSHKVVKKNHKFKEEWTERFGEKTKFREKGRETPGGMRSFWKPKDNYPCVSKLATYDSEEDICDSMVAALRNEQLLHPEKLESLREGIIKLAEKKEVSLETLKRSGKEISLPEIKSLVKFKRSKEEMDFG